MAVHSSGEPKVMVFCSTKSTKSQQLCSILKRVQNVDDPQEADLFICLGGDGFMLHTLHRLHPYNKPFYGINCGSLGLLMNDSPEDLPPEELLKTILEDTREVASSPLKAIFKHQNSDKAQTALAFNEVSLLRSEGTAVHLQISINGEVRCQKLVADGALVATSLGSSAYNHACGGPIFPLESDIVALTAINPFSPATFRSALLKGDVQVVIKPLEPQIRPVNLFCDFIKHEDVSEVTIERAKNVVARILFNNSEDLASKIYRAQFHGSNCPTL